MTRPPVVSTLDAVPKDDKIQIRCTPEEKAYWQAKTAVHGGNLGALVRWLLNSYVPPVPPTQPKPRKR